MTSHWIISIHISSRSLILSFACSNMLLKASSEVSFQLMYFSCPEFVWLLCNLHLFIDILYLFMHCSRDIL